MSKQSVKRSVKGIAALAMVLALAGCASKHPLGISSDKWEQMTFAEQLEANQRQVALNAAARAKRDNDRRELAMMRIRNAENPEIAHLPYSDVLQRQHDTADCLIQGEVRTQRGWEKAFPVHFELPSGRYHNRRIVIESWDRRWQQEAYIGYDSMGLQVCPSSLDLNNQTPRCFDVPRTPQWRQGGVIVEGEARDTFRGTAQCHQYQPVWQPANRRATQF
tara:strand:+ start:7388 stop:8047 length:660 start_codon:yes stop_codon:yes gene_type:complete